MEFQTDPGLAFGNNGVSHGKGSHVVDDELVEEEMDVFVPAVDRDDMR